MDEINPLSKFLSPLISFIRGKNTISVPGVVCGTIWGSFPVLGSFAVQIGDYLRYWDHLREGNLWGPYRSQRSKVIYKAGFWNCDEFYFGKTKRRLHERKTEHFKALAKSNHSSAIADHVKTTGHDIKWDHFDILASGKTDFHCKIKETLFIQELKPSLNANISSEKLLLY